MVSEPFTHADDENGRWLTPNSTSRLSTLRGFVPRPRSARYTASVFWKGALGTDSLHQWLWSVADSHVNAIEIDWWSDQQSSPLYFNPDELRTALKRGDTLGEPVGSDLSTVTFRASTMEFVDGLYFWGTFGRSPTDAMPKDAEIGITAPWQMLARFFNQIVYLAKNTSHETVSAQDVHAVVGAISAMAEHQPLVAADPVGEAPRRHWR